MKEYKPTPVDTQCIELPEELNSLVEEMSKNVHEVWAQTRITQDGPMEKSEMMQKRNIHA